MYAVWKEKTKPVTGIGINIEKISLQTGVSYSLKAEIMPQDAEDDTVIWKSSDISVAEVNEAGLITAKDPGNAVISAVSVDGGYTSSCLVTVENVSPADIADENTMTLPSGTRIVEEEAFYGTAANVIVLPEGAEKISASAFAGCRNLKSIVIPDSMLVIADQIFDEDLDVQIICYKGTTAERWALKHGVKLFIRSEDAS